MFDQYLTKRDVRGSLNNSLTSFYTPFISAEQYFIVSRIDHKFNRIVLARLLNKKAMLKMLVILKLFQ